MLVADRNNFRVDEFNEAGEFVRAFGWGVSGEHSENKLQTCTTACRTGIDGAAAASSKTRWGSRRVPRGASGLQTI